MLIYVFVCYFLFLFIPSVLCESLMCCVKRVMEAPSCLRRSHRAHWQAVMEGPSLTTAQDGWDRGSMDVVGAPVPCHPHDTPLLRCFLLTHHHSSPHCKAFLKGWSKQLVKWRSVLLRFLLCNMLHSGERLHPRACSHGGLKKKKLKNYYAHRSSLFKMK